jgi:NADH:flavin oxidoreductase / NADH oxidase family
LGSKDEYGSHTQALFTPVCMGKLELRNRIIMAPLTRMPAANGGHAPTELQAGYYAQRASAGLIIGPRLAARLTVGLILLVYGALRKFGDGAV